jgi:hypothetical protein
MPPPPPAIAVALPGGRQTMWPPPSNASRTALSLTLTRAAIHAHYAQMTVRATHDTTRHDTTRHDTHFMRCSWPQDHAYYNMSLNGDLYAPRKLPVQTMSDISIYTLWKGTTRHDTTHDTPAHTHTRTI